VEETQQSLPPFSVYKTFYLVGIKGVAMTSLAQILIDLDKTVLGCDVSEAFVTQAILNDLSITCDEGFTHNIPETVDCVIYTAAHQGAQNPIVKEATKKGLPTYSQAEALGHVFNAKKGIAVCGVGGKSTTSAMLTWILSELSLKPSYSVGVGSIVGLPRTGVWNTQSDFFVAEADEYVTNPQEVQNGAQPEPRFSYLQPYCTVCTNLAYDHPDVYSDFSVTKKAFMAFFSQIKAGGILILNHKDLPELELPTDTEVKTFGSAGDCDYLYVYEESESNEGITKATLIIDQKRYQLTLKVPGRYNVENAVAAIAACDSVGIDIQDALKALETFASTQRRFEFKGEKNEILFYDDYAHHPSELSAVIRAAKSWYKNKQLYIAFQPHTYSRTKSLLDDFATVLSSTTHLILLDIFASARESLDETVSSSILAEEISNQGYTENIPVLPNYSALAEYISDQIPKGSVCITLGAGDIYKVHELL